jgi:cbb3-type cytochrome oxidase maturation protein
MNILLVLIPVTGLIVFVGVVVFFWAANHQQFDDLDSPAVLPLLEDEPAQEVEAEHIASSDAPSSVNEGERP